MTGFVAIDFETSNRGRGSICQVGIAVVVDDEIVSRESWLSRPPASIKNGIFEPVCVDVHGITPRMVVGAPPFPETYDRIIDIVGALPLVAHNAPFDRSTLKAACAAEGLAVPRNDWVCTLKQARAALPNLNRHRLPDVAAFLGIDQVHHHDAADDAVVAAMIHIALTRMTEG